jgi:hypothetical protein
MTYQEEWRPVVGFEGLYEVSNLGRVRSLDRVLNQRCRWGGAMLKLYRGRCLEVAVDRRGRRSVGLWVLGENKRRMVSGIVAAAFLGPRPDGMEVCHCDGDRSNDAAANLRYDTHVGNEADKKLHGTYLYGERGSAAKLTEDQARAILASRRRGVDLAETYGVTPAAISAIRTGKNWPHLKAR